MPTRRGTSRTRRPTTPLLRYAGRWSPVVASVTGSGLIGSGLDTAPTYPTSAFANDGFPFARWDGTSRSEVAAARRAGFDIAVCGVGSATPTGSVPMYD